MQQLWDLDRIRQYEQSPPPAGEWMQNAMYGVEGVLKRYAGLPATYAAKCIIEHGCYCGDEYWHKDVFAPFPVVFTFSERSHVYRQFSSKLAFAIGPHICYARGILSPQTIALEKKKLGRTLLYFSSHSTPHAARDTFSKSPYQQARVFAEANGYDTVLTCLYWLDITRGEAEDFPPGEHLLTAGHIYDPLFLDRLRSMFDLADGVCSPFGTQLFYARALGKELFFVPNWSECALPQNRAISCDYLSRLNNIRYFHDCFARPGRIEQDSNQMRFIDEFCGCSCVRTPQELLDIFQTAEELHGGGTGYFQHSPDLPLEHAETLTLLGDARRAQALRHEPFVRSDIRPPRIGMKTVNGQLLPLHILNISDSDGSPADLPAVWHAGALQSVGQRSTLLVARQNRTEFLPFVAPLHRNAWMLPPGTIIEDKQIKLTALLQHPAVKDAQVIHLHSVSRFEEMEDFVRALAQAGKVVYHSIRQTPPPQQAAVFGALAAQGLLHLAFPTTSALVEFARAFPSAASSCFTASESVSTAHYFRFGARQARRRSGVPDDALCIGLYTAPDTPEQQQNFLCALLRELANKAGKPVVLLADAGCASCIPDDDAYRVINTTDACIQALAGIFRAPDGTVIDHKFFHQRNFVYPPASFFFEACDFALILGDDAGASARALEYQAGAVPLVASAQSLCAGMILDDATGFVYSGDDASSLASRLFSADLQHMREQVSQHFAATHNPVAQATIFLEHYSVRLRARHPQTVIHFSQLPQAIAPVIRKHMQPLAAIFSAPAVPSAGVRRVLHLSTSDQGAQGRSAYRIHRALLARGIDSKLLVLQKGNQQDHSVGLLQFMQNGTLLPPEASYQLAMQTAGLDSDQYPQATTQPFQTNATKVVFAELQAIIQQSDVIHIHDCAGFFDYRAAGLFAGKRVVWTLYDLQPVTGGCHSPGTCTRYAAPEGCRACPLVGEGPADPARQAWQQKAEYWSTFNGCVVATCDTLASAAAISTHLRNLPHTPVCLVPPVLPPERPESANQPSCRSRFGLPQQAQILLYFSEAANAYPSAQQHLQEALHHLPAMTAPDVPLLLAVVGDGPLPQNIPQAVVRLGALASDEQLAFAYASADLCVCPSPSPFQAILVLESLAYGTPAVCFSDGPGAEYVTDQVTGWLAAADTPEALAACILRALQAPRSEAARAACRSAAIRFTCACSPVERYQMLYDHTD